MLTVSAMPEVARRATSFLMPPNSMKVSIYSMTFPMKMLLLQEYTVSREKIPDGHIGRPVRVCIPLLHVGEALHRLDEALDGFVRVTVLDAVPDAVADVAPSTTLPQPLRADLAALIWERMSSQGTSSSTIRSMACTCPMIFFSLRCRLSASIHCFMFSPPYRWG